MGARIAPPFMEATDASRLVCLVVVSYGVDRELTAWRRLEDTVTDECVGLFTPDKDLSLIHI